MDRAKPSKKTIKAILESRSLRKRNGQARRVDFRTRPVNTNRGYRGSGGYLPRTKRPTRSAYGARIDKDNPGG